MLRVMIPLIFTWEVLWIVDDRVNKVIFLCVFYKSAFYKSTFYKSSPVQSAKYSMPSITTSIKQALIDAHFVPQECFQVSCARKNNDIYINSSLPSYLFYEKLINFSIFVIIYNLIRILYVFQVLTSFYCL